MTTLRLSSSAFAHGKSIPAVYTRCDGEDLSPPLTWSGVPLNTNSLALIVDDPDAPDPLKPKTTWVHWVLYNIPPTVHALEDSITAGKLQSSMVYRGALEALNDWKQPGYGGPAPPIGTHRYFFKLYALDTVLPNLGPNANKNDLIQAMDGHILGEAEWMGKYKKAETEYV
jgi:Raf kinase inhibitor-like YbhB/YbcL family protein